MNSGRYLSLLGIFTLINLYLPLVFAGEVIDPDEERCFTNEDFMEALSNGRCWITVEGKIYDLTNSNLWSTGSHLGYSCGDTTSFTELRGKDIRFDDLIDYYGDMRLSSRVGKLCDIRSMDKPEGCGDSRCDPKQDENFRNCPQDCPPNVEDGYCVPFSDFVCDPDCGRRHDLDCICNRDSFCEVESENHDNCPGDCPPDYSDGFCFYRYDGVCDPDCEVGGDPDCDGIPKTTTTVTVTTVPGSLVTTTLPKSSITTTVEGSLSTTTTTTLSPEKPGGIGSYLPYIAVLFVVILIIFSVHRKMEARKIEKEREEFIRWKAEQESKKRDHI